MKNTLLGSTGVRISSLGFGTMCFGDTADEAVSETLFRRCLEAGIDLFDCADVYGGGRSEELLGRLIRDADCRDRIVLATKAYFPTGPGGNDRGSSRYHLIRAVEASLRRLKTDRIDLFYLHRWDDLTPLEDTLATLETLVSQGKILYPAVSNFSAWQTAKALGIAERRGFAPVAAIQPMYNLAKRQAEVEILPLCRAENLACLPYSPLGGGLLSGRYGTEKRPDAGRLLDNKMYLTRYGAPSNYQIAEQFCALAAELGHHPASLAIAWLAAQPGVTAPLIGARTIDQLAPCLAAAEIELDHETVARITAISPTPPPATDRNEEASSHNYGSR